MYIPRKADHYLVEQVVIYWLDEFLQRYTNDKLVQAYLEGKESTCPDQP